MRIKAKISAFRGEKGLTPDILENNSSDEERSGNVPGYRNLDEQTKKNCTGGGKAAKSTRSCSGKTQNSSRAVHTDRANHIKAWDSN